jgi:hypothetical protein
MLLEGSTEGIAEESLVVGGESPAVVSLVDSAAVQEIVQVIVWAFVEVIV